MTNQLITPVFSGTRSFRIHSMMFAAQEIFLIIIKFENSCSKQSSKQQHPK